MKNVYLYVWPGRRKVKSCGEHEFFDPQWGYQAKAKSWWIVRAESADQARKIAKAGYIADGPGPGILDSNVIPSLVEARAQRQRTKHLEQEGSRAGLPAHEMPKGLPVQIFSSPMLTWGTTAPHKMFEPRGVRIGYAEIPCVEVPAIVAQKSIPSIIPVARQKAIGYADVMGWQLKFMPTVNVGRRVRFTDQEGKKRMGETVKIHFEIVGGLSFEEKRKLRDW